MHFQGIQPENGLKDWVGAKKAEGPTDFDTLYCWKCCKKDTGKEVCNTTWLWVCSNSLFLPTTCMKNFLLQSNWISPRNGMLCPPMILCMSTFTHVCWLISDLALEYDAIINAGYTKKCIESPAKQFLHLYKSDNFLTRYLSKKTYSWLPQY